MKVNLITKLIILNFILKTIADRIIKLIYLDSHR